MFCSHKAILKCMFIHQIPKSLPYLKRLHVSGWIALHDLIRREVYGRPWPPAPAGWLITKWGSKLQIDWLESSAAWHILSGWSGSCVKSCRYLWPELSSPALKIFGQSACLGLKIWIAVFFFFYIIGHSCTFLVWLCCVVYCVRMCGALDNDE